MRWTRWDSENLSPRQIDDLLFAHTKLAFSDGKGTRFDIDLTDLYEEHCIPIEGSSLLEPLSSLELFDKLAPRQRRKLLVPIQGGAIMSVNWTTGTLTAATTNYAIGDMLGTEITLTGMSYKAGGSGSILSANMEDYGKVVAQLDLYGFTAASSPAADNAANSWSDANYQLKTQGGFEINFGVPVASANQSGATVSQVGQTYSTTTTTSMFVNAITRTANNFFASTTDLRYNMNIMLD